MKYLLAFVCLGLFSFANAECIPKDPAHRFAMYHDVNPLAMTKAQFNEDLDLLERHFAPMFARLGCPLVVNRDWNDSTPNAYAERKGGRCHISMFGGLARAPYQTRNGQLYVACHEIGHHIGGAPLYPSDWAADEGQADYFAAWCMKSLGRSSSAGRLALAMVLSELSGDRVLPSRLNRSTVHRSSTLHSHPPAQCRLDTMDAGAACGASGRFSPRDPKIGACHSYSLASPYKRLDAGSRPRCFYKP